MIETSPVPVPAPVLVDVVLPCLDEADALPWVLDRIPPGWRAIVVDNGSTDGSPDIARSLGAYVVHEPRRGFGAACHAGLTAATADVVCFSDCDGSLDPGLLPQVAGPVLDGSADLVLGRRRPTTVGAWPVHARLANLELARLVRRHTGLRLRDLGPMRAARRDALTALDLTDRRSGYPLQMVVRAADAGWRVQETDVPYQPRTGRSKVTGTWRGTWQAVRDMRAVLAERPSTGPAAAVAGAMRATGAAEVTEVTGVAR
ncbi:glycosyltransferase family 2 protein [Streptomyces sp. NPDC005209]|uniref:glycosyltransferase family 2 protein n=1 Tax=Streptomyces sp. NPDC005209 TaxID=3156715 RepID=UPI0033AB49F6